MEKRTITADELAELQEVNMQANALHQNIGMAIHNIEVWKQDLSDLDSRNKHLHRKLAKKYGEPVTVDLNTGEIKE